MPERGSMSTYDKLVGATAEGLLPPAVLDSIRTSGGLDQAFRRGVSAAEYGATGDGTTDDTAALQAALDQSAHRDLFIPHGRYRITETLTVPSGGVVRGENGTVLVNDANLASMIRTAGWEDPLLPIATAVGTNDREITTTTPHGLAPGDVVRFRSQRVSTSEDAGEWRLAWATSDGPGPFFGEHGTVQTVTSDTTFVLDAGLVFPGYRPDATQETSPDAGDFATVSKIRAARNVVVSTLELEGPSYIAVRAINAVDCLFENIRYVKRDAGRFIQFHTSYRCVARNCWVSNEIEVNDELSHAAVNSFHVVASQSCGFDTCTAIRGTQAFDITYSQNGRIPSLFCFVSNSSSYAALNNSLTAHPGTYAARVIGNNFSENTLNGPAIRANRSIIANNVIRGSGTGRGLYFSEGGGKESLATGNHISNFEIGLEVRDGADKQYEGWIGVTFTGNAVVDCLRGFTRFVQWDRPLQTSPEGITVLGNAFTSSLDNAIGVETSLYGRPIWGLTVQGNTFRLTGADSSAVVSTNNSRGVAVTGNTIWAAHRALRRDTSGPGHYWDDPCVTEWTGNIVHEVTAGSFPSNSTVWRLKSRDTEPLQVSGPNLDLCTETITLTPASASQVTTEAGFPVAGDDVFVEVVLRGSRSAFQYVHSATGDMHMRRRTLAGTYTSWSKRH